MLKTIFIAILVPHFMSTLPLNDEDNLRISMDLTHLGERVFGSPSNETGKKVAEWKAESDYNPEELGEYAEGDILIPARSRNGMVAETLRWKDGVVPYEIAGYFQQSDLDVIKRAMDIYHKYTCITFRKKTAQDADYLSIVSGPTGCWSSVGRIGGRQEINLQNPSCTTKVGTPMHELMHALGFLHEQNRYERDDYVSIVWKNIKKNHDNNFVKAKQEETDGFGVKYDYNSVMHYSKGAFSVNGQPTIVAKDSSKEMKMGQRDGFSKGDITKINNMYKCSNKGVGGTDTNNNNNNNSGNGNNSPGGWLSFLFNLVDK